MKNFILALIAFASLAFTFGLVGSCELGKITVGQLVIYGLVCVAIATVCILVIRHNEND